MFNYLHKFDRKTKQIIMLLFDSGAVILSLLLSFYIRLGDWQFPYGDTDLLLAIFASPALALPIFIRFGLYQEIIRYVGFKALWRIGQSVSIYAILWGLITFMAAIDFIPRSIILINWLLVIIIVCGSRLMARQLLSEDNLNNNVLIYGAGSAGRQLCTALRESNEYTPLAFIDDKSEIYNHSISGLKVYSRKDMGQLINDKNIKEVFIAIPSLSRINRKKIVSYLESYDVIVRSLPSVIELAKGKVTVKDLLEIDVKDLLGRDTVSPNKNLLDKNIADKTVLVTGAGGSIGSELCRQILFINPKRLVLYEISESSLYQIEQELLDSDLKNIEIFPVIGSISDKFRLKNVCELYSVETIYHAAAYKHVPLVEFNQAQGLQNNAIGTMIAAEVAIMTNVETFVLISTDKAVRPTNVMGASKRIAELVLQALAKEAHSTCFSMVRFGNVIDSSGSVIPLFKKQINSGGPITVTDSKIVRYFMTIPEAVELVIQAGAMAKGGEVFFLDMGDPVRIDDLARNMIRLSGLQVIDKNNPNGDIEIKYTGLRPGEKLFEELLIGENSTSTESELIMQAEEEFINWEELKPMLDEIDLASRNPEKTNLNNLIKQIVPQYNPKSNGLDAMS